MPMDATLRYTHLAFQALALLDEGYDLDLDETRKRAEAGDLLTWLASSRIDLSLYDGDVRDEISERFASLANATSTSDLGVTRSGLALVVAYCLEAIQQDRQGR
jgi:hypothetical protein